MLHAEPETDTGTDPAELHALVRQHRTGSLPAELLTRLHEERAATRDPFLVDYLDGVLSASGGQLGMLLLERVRVAAALSAEEMATLLVADVVAHEQGGDEHRRRVRHALRFVAVSTGTPPADVDPPAFPDGPAEPWFARTVTATDGDELALVRVLQAREMLFTVLADDVRAATLAVRDGRSDEAAELVAHAATMFDRATMLSRVIAIPLAGDVRSERYERFAAACGPLGTRLREARPDTLAGAVAADPESELVPALELLDAARRRWAGRLAADAIRAPRSDGSASEADAA
ncbi:MAG: hypothetical protein J0I34_23475 [Pseudonocardia sp.]|uniref:hypothetical protein n=1 Tax=unclassified Pseudonocardia TaxID=2619320 RepID=UPI00086F83A0|nr:MULTISPECIES: hypothetical protein [unclassified Pseudonocardia]MBN9111733.1 hypothetical protein [Pseudonocardia sp.]ODU25532.1 MAG: hypothetical protein ABS80_09735 [Pseudonocardia sp. SCN 72-51]ODV02315.1 MAG: hypothetical protein ABT15_25910 [Pseudonocardia sp. SCN 73-27]